jgi:hypothetical protein
MMNLPRSSTPDMEAGLMPPSELSLQVQMALGERRNKSVGSMHTGNTTPNSVHDMSAHVPSGLSDPAPAAVFPEAKVRPSRNVEAKVRSAPRRPTDAELAAGKNDNIRVRNTFVHIPVAKTDFFPVNENDDLLPPRLHGRRARTPDPERRSSIDFGNGFPLALEILPLETTLQGSGATTTITPKRQDKAKSEKSEKKKTKKKANADYLSQLSAEQKKDLAMEVYNAMKRRGFDSPEGYLLIDVYVEIFRDLVGEEGNRATALHRFASLLRGCPHLFELFHLGIKVANNCGRFARRGEKMVKILPQDGAVCFICWMLNPSSFFSPIF